MIAEMLNLQPPLMPFLGAGPVPRPSEWPNHLNTPQDESAWAALRRCAQQAELRLPNLRDKLYNCDNIHPQIPLVTGVPTLSGCGSTGGLKELLRTCHKEG